MNANASKSRKGRPAGTVAPQQSQDKSQAEVYPNPGAAQRLDPNRRTMASQAAIMERAADILKRASATSGPEEEHALELALEVLFRGEAERIKHRIRGPHGGHGSPRAAVAALFSAVPA